MISLVPEDFNAHLNELGQLFAWRPSAACPCVQAHSGAADPTCPQCAGRGRIWGGEQQGLSGISGQRVQRQWAEFGIWEDGDVVLTIPSDSPLYAVGEFDRVTMLQSSAPFSMTLTRGQNDVLWFLVESIQRVFWLDDQRQIVEGGIPVVGAGGALTWPENDGPPDFVQYSLTGRRRPEYFCFRDFPQDRAHHSGRALPRKVVLRKMDLYDRTATGA